MVAGMMGKNKSRGLGNPRRRVGDVSQECAPEVAKLSHG